MQGNKVGQGISKSDNLSQNVPQKIQKQPLLQVAFLVGACYDFNEDVSSITIVRN